MTIEKFIEENKVEIDKAIKRACPSCDLDNDEREMWIMNDEGLYQWAIDEGVEI